MCNTNSKSEKETSNKKDTVSNEVDKEQIIEKIDFNNYDYEKTLVELLG